MPDAGIKELEHLLEGHLNTRVRVDLKEGRKGRVIVEFADSLSPAARKVAVAGETA